MRLHKVGDNYLNLDQVQRIVPIQTDIYVDDGNATHRILRREYEIRFYFAGGDYTIEKCNSEAEQKGILAWVQ